MLTIRPGAVRSVGSVKKRVLAVLTVLYVAAVLAATLTPAGFPTRVFDGLFRGGGTVAVSAGTPRVDVVANILMFAPIGLLFVLLARRWWLALAAAGALTVLIELVQLGIPSRIADVNDVLLNALGALIGAAVGEVLLRSGSAGTRRYRAGSAASAPTSP